MSTTQEQLLADIEGHMEETGMAASNFGLEVTGDPNLVFDLRKGREVRLGTLDRIRTFLEKPSAA